MMNEKMVAALNQQINEEYYSSYIYLAMAAYLDDSDLDGMGHWMRMQAQEEYLHAMKIFDFMVERGARIKLSAVAEPPFEWETPLAAFEAALDHERYMTDNINKLVDLAISERDHATNNIMQWYVSEQVEEEANVEGIVKKMKMMGDSGQGLFLMDRELASRPVPTIVADGQ
ncbi:MAG: ferritin [bacterium]|nr:ferritin [bacterium]